MDRPIEDDRRNIKLILEYDGTGLAGWQRQKDQPTVQGYLESALGRLTGERVKVIGAGRTDAGVHALGQTAHFRTASRLSPSEIQRGGNALLPGQIVILSAEEAPPEFHARYSALSKIYDYRLFLSPVRPALKRLFVWHLSRPLDLEAMRAALDRLVGRHDFAGFQSTGSPVKSTVRRVQAVSLTREADGLVTISLEADGFLRHMVRSIVGTLVEVGSGRMNLDEFGDILKERDRSRAGPTAPAHGLCLKAVKY